MHADTDTGADVTARALARVEAARARADDLVYDADDPLDYATLAKVADRTAADLPLLCDIAAAAVRLVVAMPPIDDSPWWAWYSEGIDWMCVGCGHGDASHAGIDHAPDCAAMQLDAAIRAAGEAGHA